MRYVLYLDYTEINLIKIKTLNFATFLSPSPSMANLLGWQEEFVKKIPTKKTSSNELIGEKGNLR